MMFSVGENIGGNSPSLRNLTPPLVFFAFSLSFSFVLCIMVFCLVLKSKLKQALDFIAGTVRHNSWESSLFSDESCVCAVVMNAASSSSSSSEESSLSDESVACTALEAIFTLLFTRIKNISVKLHFQTFFLLLVSLLLLICIVQDDWGQEDFVRITKCLNE